MVEYNCVHVVVWWCDCLFAYLCCVFWLIEALSWPENGTTWDWFHYKLHRSPSNFWSLYPTGSNCFTRYSRNLADLNYNRRDRRDWSMVSKGNQEPLRTRVSSFLTMVLSLSYECLEWQTTKCTYIFLDRKSSLKMSSNLLLSSRAYY